MTSTQELSDVVRSVLRDAPVLTPLDREARLELATRAEVRPVARGERLFREGEPSREVFLVASGRLQCCHHCDGPREWVSAVVRSSGVVGLVDVLDGAERGGCALALEPTTVVAVPAADWIAAMDRSPAFAGHLARALAKELRATQRMCGAVALRTPLQRVAEFLLTAANGGEEGALAETQGRIAAQIGTVREVVGRALRRLERQAIIQRRGRTFRILKREELERLAR